MKHKESRIGLASGLGIVLAFCLLQVALPATAQPPPQTENRFLFIINTSSGMRGDSNGIQEAVVGLLKSSMQGQMRDGDTFGLWTYDDQVHTDFPMQVWSKPKLDAIVDQVTAFLNGRRYQKRARLDRVLPVLREVMTNSRVLTAIFIFDGTETMHETGFDKDINDLHKEFGRDMRASHIPFVTVLASHDGKVFEYSVNTPASITLPKTVEFLPPPVTNAPPAAATNIVVAPKPPEPRRRELIMTAPTPVKTNVAVAVSEAVAPIPPPKSEPVVPVTPTPVQTAPGEVSERVAAATVEPAKVVVPPRPMEVPAAEPVTKPMPPMIAPANPPPVVATVPVTPAPATPAVEAPPTVAAGPGKAPPPPPPAVTLAQTAVAIPSSEDHIALLVIAFSLVTIAVVLVLFLVRRSRGTPSLISQSLDRPR